MPKSDSINIRDIFNPSCEIISWAEYGSNSYSIRYVWGAGDVDMMIVSRTELDEWDPRINKVLDVYSLEGRLIDEVALKLTVTSHWKYQNHAVDPDKSHEKPAHIHAHKLHELLKIERRLSNFNEISVQVHLYNVKTTQDGIEYVCDQLRSSLRRPLSWLDHHYIGGKTLLEFGESIGASPEEIAVFLQAQYKAQIQPNADIIDLPNGSDFSV